VQDETIVGEFTHQAEAFAASAIANASETLDGLVRLAAPRPDERWLDVACGPGIVCRALAPHVLAVHGVDLTPAMVQVARRESAAAELGNATFGVGDATALGLPDASVDGAVARFAIHHIPLPGRLFAELARVVRPGGRVVLADHLLDQDASASAWSQEIERLRDPSHWASLTLDRLHALAANAGLRIEDERVFTVALDFEAWLARGSGAVAAAELVEHALSQPPAEAGCFRVREHDGRRVLELRMWMARLRR
jgi:SAM-dependent methyltransferase